jgi:hypothetical protein
VELVATHGWKLIPQYRFDLATGLWRHENGPVEPPLRLTDVAYDADGVMTYPRHDDTAPETALAGYLDEARELFATLPDAAELPQATDVALGADLDRLRWFDLPAVSLR